jgi:MipA family protein
MKTWSVLAVFISSMSFAESGQGHNVIDKELYIPAVSTSFLANNEYIFTAPKKSKNKSSTEEPLEELSLPSNQWNVKLALGYGQRTNPYFGNKDLDLIAVPSISYYGEKFFFDNGLIGFSFIEDPRSVVSVVTELNPLTAQTYLSHPRNFLISNNKESSFGSPLIYESTNASGVSRFYTNKALNRPTWSLDIGLQYNWFVNRSLSFSLQAFTEVTNVHNGERAEVYGSYFGVTEGMLAGWQYQLEAGFSIYDRHTTQFFFGIDNRHIVQDNLHYQTSSSINPWISIVISKPISEKWSFLTTYKQTRLDSVIFSSRQIKDQSVSSYFVGVTYGF